MRAWARARAAIAAAALALVGAALAVDASAERFDEDLLLRPLPDGGIHAAFQFVINSGRGGLDVNEEEDDIAEDGAGLAKDEDALGNVTAGPRPSASRSSHFRLLPRSLIQIARAAGTREFKLSINAGSWQYAAWGEPTLDVVAPSSAPSDGGAGSGSASSRLWAAARRASGKAPRGSHDEARAKVLGDDAVGNGAELWASFLPPAALKVAGGEGPSGPEHARLSWRTLTSALAGLFCASLDTTLSPRVALRPSDAHLFSSASSSSQAARRIANTSKDESVLLHAFAPSESICTENLTPFLKLLPCRSASAGLAQLLNPHALFSSAYHGLSVQVTRLNEGAAEEQWRVQLRVQAVYTAAKAKGRGRTAEELALRPLFDRNVTQACPLATTSNVYVPRPPRLHDVKDDDENEDAIATPDEDVLLLDDDDAEEYELPSWPTLNIIEPMSSSIGRKKQRRRRVWRTSPHSSSFSDVALSGLALAYELAAVPLPPAAPSLEVYRTHTSAHPTHGSLVLTLTNRHPTEPVRAHYYDEMPWWMKVWMHTLRVVKVEDISSGPGKRSPPTRAATPSDDGDGNIVRFVDDLLCPPLLAVHYEPSAGRDLSKDATVGSGRPSLLELDLRVPASATVTLRLDYDLAFLRYTEHPPGPQKGWGVPPAVVVVLADSDEAGESVAQSSASLCPVKVPRHRPGTGSTGKQAALTRWTPPSLPPMARPAPIGRHGVLRRVYTEAALIELAVPDFSMIYNLILFTSTEIALFFGSMFNMLVRRFGDVVL